jgi:hypothetical protein
VLQWRGTVTGHDFSRAVSGPKSTRALAPEGWFFGFFDFNKAGGQGIDSILEAREIE